MPAGCLFDSSFLYTVRFKVKKMPSNIPSTFFMCTVTGILSYVHSSDILQDWRTPTGSFDFVYTFPVCLVYHLTVTSVIVVGPLPTWFIFLWGFVTSVAHRFFTNIGVVILYPSEKLRLLASINVSYCSGIIIKSRRLPMDPESDREDDDSMGSPSTATSFDLERSRHSASPVSVVSVNSNMQFFKKEYGRQLNNYSDIYHLPADREELERLSTSPTFRKDCLT